jgi:exonuclease VII small subunit
MLRLIGPALAAALMLPALPVMAQEGERYRLERSGEGFVRMDRRTGIISYCEERAGELVCRMTADDREAFEDEIDRLQKRIDALESRLQALENRLAELAEGDLPSEEELDRTLSFMEQFFRRFMGIVREFEREWGGEPRQSEGERT